MKISYQIPTRIASGIGLREATIFFSGYNLLTWSKVINRYQLDPGIGRNKNTFIYPVQRIFNFGFKFSFK